MGAIVPSPIALDYNYKYIHYTSRLAIKDMGRFDCLGALDAYLLLRRPSLLSLHCLLILRQPHLLHNAILSRLIIPLASAG